MRIYLDQIGCRLNYSEMETLAQRLRAAGHRVVATPEQAQVILFNSCAVTGGAVRDSRKRVGQLQRANHAARIAVTGCWATLEPGRVAALPGVALVAPNPQKELLAALLEPWSAELDGPEALAQLQPDAVPLGFALQEAGEHAAPSAAEGTARTRAFVKVQDGCNNRCTFCIVTALRGESRSRPLAEIVAEIGQLAAAGVKEAVLTGVHLGSYGRDLQGGRGHAAGDTLKELVAAILGDTDIARLRLSSLEPWELAEGFFDLWARWPGRLCPHLHLPLQAGTDKQLRAMARRCTTASYRALVAAARTAIPDLTVTTDLIAGFPGETDEDFAAGIAFVEEMRFSHAHIFPFSARTGTAAAHFDGQLPRAVKQARVQQLQQAVNATGRHERLRFVGTTRPVLWEGQGRLLADRPGQWLWSGLTDNYLRVLAAAPAGFELHNQLQAARLDTLEGDVYAGVLIAPDHAPAAPLRG